MRLRNAQGTFQAGGAEYVVAAPDAQIVGDYDGTLSVSDGETVPVGRLVFSGTFASTDLPVRSTRVSAAGSAFWPLAIGSLALAGLATVVIAATVRHRRHAGPPMGIDEYVELSRVAASEERWSDALAWTRRALLLKPDDPRLLTDAAFFLASLGSVTEALATYDRAAQRAPDGEPDFLAAGLLLDAGGDADAAAARLARALARTPTYALEVATDARFARLRERPDVAEAIARAERELG
jgi:tetratricopeptide (TPR) repeat protein